MPSVFPVLSLDRRRCRWEDQLETLTPVERHGDLYFKREDYFAPLGYGGINGGKVRQILWVLTRYLAKRPKKPGLLLAGSVKSPQLGRVAAVGRHFKIPVALVTYSDPEKARHVHENVRIAHELGAEFHRAKAPYNPALQRAAAELHARPAYKDFYLMEYGLSVEGTLERVEAFYRFCSEQVRNIPDDVDTLLLPAGSCNTTISVLYGLARHRPKALKTVVLFGIGPPRVEWFELRLKAIGQHAGLAISGLFRREYPHHPELAPRFGVGPDAPYRLVHYDLHSTGYASYQDEMPASYEGIELHPTYEGKMLSYIREHAALRPLIDGGRSLFWVVGSTPSWEAMSAHVWSS